MNKKQLLELIARKEARKTEIGNLIKEAKTVEELRSLQTELNQLNDDIVNFRSIADIFPDDSNSEPTDPAARGAGPGKTDPTDPTKSPAREPEARGANPQGLLNPLGTYSMGGDPTKQNEEREAQRQKMEQRGANLKAGKAVTFGLSEIPLVRSITIDTVGLVIPDQYSNNLNPTFNEVSSIVDLVNAITMPNGETYTQGFEKPSSDSGDYTADGSDYHDADPVYDYVTIAKTSVTAYTEISKQASKLPNVNYQARCSTSVRKSLRKKLAREIMIGDGGAGHFTGIFNAPANVIPASSDLAIAEIDADTLDNIVFKFGGDEDVEDPAYLILNKLDLAAFAAIRSADGKKLYKIVTKGNTGTISSDDSFSVNYILNSVCPALSATATTSETYCMAYGILQNYEMPIFSDIDIQMSTDYKFKQGMTAYAGEVYAGGNVAAYKGFIRIKKE
ncbi:phage major capsid protein [Desulfosporosinus sp. PR]|uniref:phage major capsid protein n=1 Tax=Candidatus Desulfosporosinus nitrosoreducens TaxID=3401928 RepID=UPI0027ED0394|nr:phage major capsid protein [Desulfosporosinus sp. PR]MDQ7095949.1 phage major capsid protein [Desulfosporosinus sp. PR]